MVKAYELQGLSRTELLKQLDELRGELSSLRVAQVTGGTPAKLAKIKEVRKSIARVLTTYNTTRKNSLRVEFKNAKYQPLDLRPKYTRAMRRRLTPSQAANTTLRQRKKAAHNPARKYAVKA
eukprot:TRINITY_DN457_c0_g1_i1.p1 TRINITY_DN457_c0_g1~~TRINITY_DN457_c0_g1_i1.p1  ORF type:complete len:122 (-),score=37.10 TRINITY_DN457_c0_g1_i1:64-429(-)